jgi:hypothetical protein
LQAEKVNVGSGKGGGKRQWQKVLDRTINNHECPCGGDLFTLPN